MSELMTVVFQSNRLCQGAAQRLEPAKVADPCCLAQSVKPYSSSPANIAIAKDRLRKLRRLNRREKGFTQRQVILGRLERRRFRQRVSNFLPCALANSLIQSRRCDHHVIFSIPNHQRFEPRWLIVGLNNRFGVDDDVAATLEARQGR